MADDDRPPTKATLSSSWFPHSDRTTTPNPRTTPIFPPCRLPCRNSRLVLCISTSCYGGGGCYYYCCCQHKACLPAGLTAASLVLACRRLPAQCLSIRSTAVGCRRPDRVGQACCCWAWLSAVVSVSNNSLLQRRSSWLLSLSIWLLLHSSSQFLSVTAYTCYT